MTRKEAEDARQAKLVELRKKYLDSKGIISKARPSAKVKLTGLDKVEAEREAKLVELREKYLAKKRAVTKNDGKLASAVKRSSGVFKKKTLAPTTSVRPIARTTTTDPKKEKGYFVNKKKGNAMVRVFPNISPALYGRMSAKERKALNLPSPNSTKYTVDFNQRNALTFIIKN